MWISNFNDGLWDLYFGLLLFGFGFSPLLESAGLLKPLNFLVFPLLAFAVLFLGKKFIVIPRMGRVRFGAKRKSDHKKLVIIGILFFIATCSLLFILKFTSLRPSWNESISGFTTPIGFAIFFIIAISIIAYFMEFQRLYFHAFLFGISIPLAEALYFKVGEPFDGLIAFTMTSSPILLTGLILLVKFYRMYPIPKEEN